MTLDLPAEVPKIGFTFKAVDFGLKLLSPKLSGLPKQLKLRSVILSVIPQPPLVPPLRGEIGGW